MHRHAHKTTALLVAVTLFFAFVLTACNLLPGADQRSSSNSPSYSLKAPEQDRHDIDIISIDFDPPLNKDRTASTSLDNIALMVAVDNRGNKTERDLSVEAKLMGEHENDLIETKTQNIDTLAPGEARIVKFPHFSQTRTHANYTVKVEVTSVAGQQTLGNNSKAIGLSFEPR